MVICVKRAVKTFVSQQTELKPLSEFHGVEPQASVSATPTSRRRFVDHGLGPGLHRLFHNVGQDQLVAFVRQFHV